LHLMKHVDRSRFDLRMGLLNRSGPYVPQIDPAHVMGPRIGERFMDFERGNREAYQLTSLAPAVVLTPANVVAMLRDFEPHVVVSFRKGMSVIALAAVTLYGRSRLRFIAREGNNTLAVIADELASPLARRAVQELTARVYRAADRFLTISYEMADELKTQLALDPSRVRTIHNAVDLDEVERRAAQPSDFDAGGPYVIAVGRLERQKGFDVLLRAFAASAHRRSHRLMLLGEGAHEQALRDLAGELGVADRLLLPGWRDNPWALMRRADLFVLPSRWEGFGNVVIEAMASRVPVVVSDCSYGPKEIVRHSQDGLVVPVEDVAATTSAIDTLLGDRALAARYVQSAAERARDFGVPVIVKRYEALFLEAARELNA
ncbi:MAG TPA: glycosyltransferase, partial [Polyangiales bacterium]|nr:glycosyltransferase [Polyangiales bacterium]